MAASIRHLQESFDTILVSKFNACPQTAMVEWNVTLLALDRPDTVVPRIIHTDLGVLLRFRGVIQNWGGGIQN